MRSSRATVIAVVALLASACGDPDDGAAAPRPADRLTTAITQLAEGGTGHFASETAGSDGASYSRIEGDFQLTPPAARVTVARRGLAGEVTTEVLAIGRDAWSRDPGSCWVHYDVTELFANGLLVRNGDTYFPTPIAVAASGLGVYSTDADQVSGTSELTAVLSVADLSLPSLLGLDQAAGHRVLATFTLDDDGLTGWTVATRAAVEQARQHATSTAAGDTRLSELAALRGTISTELSAIGDAVEIAPPSPDQAVEYVADPDELAERLAACSDEAP